MADVTLANLDRLVFAAWLDSAVGVNSVDLLPTLEMPPAPAEAEASGCSCSSYVRDRQISESTGRDSGSFCVISDVNGLRVCLNP